MKHQNRPHVDHSIVRKPNAAWNIFLGMFCSDTECDCRWLQLK